MSIGSSESPRLDIKKTKADAMQGSAYFQEKATELYRMGRQCTRAHIRDELLRLAHDFQRMADTTADAEDILHFDGLARFRFEGHRP